MAGSASATSAAKLSTNWSRLPTTSSSPRSTATAVSTCAGSTCSTAWNSTAAAPSSCSGSSPSGTRSRRCLVPANPRPHRAAFRVRWRETEIHHVDLDVDYTQDHWPTEFVRLMLPRVVPSVGTTRHRRADRQHADQCGRPGAGTLRHPASAALKGWDQSALLSKKPISSPVESTRESVVAHTAFNPALANSFSHPARVISRCSVMSWIRKYEL
jgi:hypothetical protein